MIKSSRVLLESKKYTANSEDNLHVDAAVDVATTSNLDTTNSSAMEIIKDVVRGNQDGDLTALSDLVDEYAINESHEETVATAQIANEVYIAAEETYKDKNVIPSNDTNEMYDTDPVSSVDGNDIVLGNSYIFYVMY
jgi:hypothetical protein